MTEHVAYFLRNKRPGRLIFSRNKKISKTHQNPSKPIVFVWKNHCFWWALISGRCLFWGGFLFRQIRYYKCTNNKQPIDRRKYKYICMYRWSFRVDSRYLRSASKCGEFNLEYECRSGNLRECDTVVQICHNGGDGQLDHACLRRGWKKCSSYYRAC